MAGKKPSFITGATAKIKVGGKTFAYCSDVAYNVVVDVIPIETMGRFEAVTNEPVNYSVSGSLSVVRYTNIAKSNNIAGTTATGNGLGNVNYNGSGGNAAHELNPGNILASKTWDLAVFQKTQETAIGQGPGTGGATAGTVEAVEFITIRDCRFRSKSASINKRGILVDRYDFVGIIAGDDSFEAGYSGDTDLT